MHAGHSLLSTQKSLSTDTTAIPIDASLHSCTAIGLKDLRQCDVIRKLRYYLLRRHSCSVTSSCDAYVVAPAPRCAWVRLFLQCAHIHVCTYCSIVLSSRANHFIYLITKHFVIQSYFSSLPRATCIKKLNCLKHGRVFSADYSLRVISQFPWQLDIVH